MEQMSFLDRLIADAMRKPADQRMKELETMLDSGKLTMPQLQKIQKELFELRKRFKSTR